MPNPWKQFEALLPKSPRLCGTVVAHHEDGTSAVELLGGGVLIVRGLQVAIGKRAFAQDGRLESEAPEGELVEIEI